MLLYGCHNALRRHASVRQVGEQNTSIKHSGHLVQQQQTVLPHAAVWRAVGTACYVASTAISPPAQPHCYWGYKQSPGMVYHE